MDAPYAESYQTVKNNFSHLKHTHMKITRKDRYHFSFITRFSFFLINFRLDSNQRNVGETCDFRTPLAFAPCATNRKLSIVVHDQCITRFWEIGAITLVVRRKRAVRLTRESDHFTLTITWSDCDNIDAHTLQLFPW
jgi:hypothetical protein